MSQGEGLCVVPFPLLTICLLTFVVLPYLHTTPRVLFCSQIIVSAELDPDGQLLQIENHRLQIRHVCTFEFQKTGQQIMLLS